MQFASDVSLSRVRIRHPRRNGERIPPASLFRCLRELGVQVAGRLAGTRAIKFVRITSASPLEAIDREQPAPSPCPSSIAHRRDSRVLRLISDSDNCRLPSRGIITGSLGDHTIWNTILAIPTGAASIAISSSIGVSPGGREREGRKEVELTGIR